MSIKDLFQLNRIVLIVFSTILIWSAYLFCSKLAVNSVYDFFIRISSPTKVSNDIVVVTIDDESINKVGRWPWKRTYYTDIFEYLENTAGAKAIAFDSAIISYGNEEDDKEFFTRLSNLDKVIPGLFFSMDEGNGQLDELLHKFSIDINDHRKDKQVYKGCKYPLMEVMEASKSMGSVLSRPDQDGIIRKAELVFSYNGKEYPSLALAVNKLLNPETEFEVKNNFNYIRWYKGSPYKTISAWEILKQSEINPSIFKDKIVVVGTTATALKDIKSTPLGADYPGVYIQATLIDNILNNEFMTKPSKLQELLLLGCILIIGFLAVFYLSPLYSSVLLSFIGIGYFYICLFFAYPNSIALDPITPIVFLICVMLIGYGYEYFIEDEKKRKTRALIAKYVSKDIMESILSDIDGTKLGGKRSEISVLFADIRNFTSISENMPPEKVSELLNQYFSRMIPIIFKYQGTVNKFMGDALLVIFGAPVENPEHPKLAVQCALEILKESESLSNIDIGIGISSGEAFVGNIGSEERFEYTAIGNTVNLASRLESFNKQYETSILISESTFERVNNIVEVKEIDSVALTQNSEPTKVFELLKLKP